VEEKEWNVFGWIVQESLSQTDRRIRNHRPSFLLKIRGKFNKQRHRVTVIVRRNGTLMQQKGRGLRVRTETHHLGRDYDSWSDHRRHRGRTNVYIRANKLKRGDCGGVQREVKSSSGRTGRGGSGRRCCARWGNVHVTMLLYLSWTSIETSTRRQETVRDKTGNARCWCWWVGRPDRDRVVDRPNKQQLGTFVRPLAISCHFRWLRAKFPFRGDSPIDVPYTTMSLESCVFQPWQTLCSRYDINIIIAAVPCKRHAGRSSSIDRFLYVLFLEHAQIFAKNGMYFDSFYNVHI